MQVRSVNHNISQTWAMFHLRVFSTSICTICKSVNHLLAWAVFSDLKMTQGRWCKLFILSWNVWNFGNNSYFSILVSSADFLLLDIRYGRNIWTLRKLYFSDKKLFKIFWYLRFYFIQKRAELIAEKFIGGRRNIPNPLLNIICAVLSI